MKCIRNNIATEHLYKNVKIPRFTSRKHQREARPDYAFSEAKTHNALNLHYNLGVNIDTLEYTVKTLYFTTICIKYHIMPFSLFYSWNDVLNLLLQIFVLVCFADYCLLCRHSEGYINTR